MVLRLFFQDFYEIYALSSCCGYSLRTLGNVNSSRRVAAVLSGLCEIEPQSSSCGYSLRTLGNLALIVVLWLSFEDFGKSKPVVVVLWLFFEDFMECELQSLSCGYSLRALGNQLRSWSCGYSLRTLKKSSPDRCVVAIL